jgi:hypothetical protein
VTPPPNGHDKNRHYRHAVAAEWDIAMTESSYGLFAEPEPRYTRRLSDKILIAFHNACDEKDLDVAMRLLDVLESTTRRSHTLPTTADRRVKESLVAAYERLWHLRRPETDQI